MPLSKKYYVKIAKSLCQAYLALGGRSEDCRLVLDDLTDDLMRQFKADNPRFDREKFVKAVQCKVK